MSNQKLNLGITGLATNTNNLLLPDGAVISATNMNIDRKIAEVRRGFERHSLTSNIRRLTEYQNTPIAWKTNNTLNYYSSGWTSLGSLTPPTNQTVKFQEVNQNLYITSSSGVKVIDAYNGTIYNTGMPKGLDGEASTTGASGFMATNTQIAYRVVWGSRDVSKNLYLGSPSQRILAINTSGGTRDVSLTFTIPSGITVDDFFQVYRSRESASSTTEPDDELQLVYEANPSAGEITAKSITYTDSTPNSLKGAYLYTNANQEGISETNDEPPTCNDIAVFKGFTFFAGIKTKHSISVNLLAVSGSGLALNDTITINSMVFTAKAATTIASREFKLFTAGSAAQNIDDTARELVKVVNQYASNTSVYAYYVTGYSDLPGQIVISERTPSGSSFSVSVSRAAAWDVDNDGTSTNNDYQAGLMWSKIQQPEHVPSSHLEQIGSKSFPIIKLTALKDALFIMKEDGIFRLTGNDGKWVIDTLDSSTSIVAPDTAAIMNNQVFCLSNQGVITITDTGVAVISEDIKDSLQELIGLDYDNLKELSFGVAYHTDRKYILSTISNASDTLTTQQWIYNVFTNKWSRWEKDATCGLVSTLTDKLWFADTTQMLTERKTFTTQDFIDEDLDGYSVVSSASTNVVLNSTVGLTVGDLLYSDSTNNSPIVSIDAATNTVTVATVKTWAAGAVQVKKAIESELEWAPQYCDNSGMEKTFAQLMLMFKNNNFSIAYVDFYTDTNGGWESVEVEGLYGQSAWGGFAWGSIPWGGLRRSSPTRLSVPRNKARGQLLGIRFRCRFALSYFSLEGISLHFDSVSERQGSRT